MMSPFPDKPVPFNRPAPAGKELEYIRDAMERGHLCGDGYYTRQCENILRHQSGAVAAYLTHSCTAALEMAAILLDLGPGDEVIMPSYTFVSTANAVVLRGATPVFVDIRPDTLNLDETKVRAAISEKTRAIFVVHYAGVIAEMDVLQTIANEFNLKIVEDAAQAIGSAYKGRPAGSFGCMATLSFHETKNVISGEGGVLLINDPDYIDRAAIIREKGTNRRAFFQGKVDKYSWCDIGSSYLPGELVAAFLYAQLEQANRIRNKRLEIWDIYHRELEDAEQKGWLKRPALPRHCRHNAHMYYFLLPTADLRPKVIAAMQQAGFNTPFHYIPLHSAPAGKKFGRCAGSMVVTDDLSYRLVRLPLFYTLELEDARRISRHLTDILKNLDN